MYREKIATPFIIVHISSPAILVQRRKQAYRIDPFQLTYPTLSEKDIDLQLPRPMQRQAQPPMYNPYPCTILCRMRPGQVAARTIKRNNAGLLSLRVQIRAMQQTPKLPNISR